MKWRITGSCWGPACHRIRVDTDDGNSLWYFVTKEQFDKYDRYGYGEWQDGPQPEFVVGTDHEKEPTQETKQV